MVPRGTDEHGCINHEEEEGVQGANVIQDVGVSVGHHKEKDCKIKSPKHLKHSQPSKVLFNVEERKVSEARHPHVARDHHTNRVVHFLCMEVVIPRRL